jgi:hypothetical protein
MIALFWTGRRITLLVTLLACGGSIPAVAVADEPTSLTATALAPLPTAAHELGQSYMFLRIHDDSIVVRVEITVADLELALGFGWDPEDVIMSMVQGRLADIRAYAEPHFSLSTVGGPLPIRFDNVDVRYLEIADYVVLTYLIDGLDAIPDEVEVLYSVLFEADGNHRNMLIIEYNWKTATFNNEAIVSLIFSPRNATQTLDLTSSSILRGFIGFIRLGTWHIWIGIDHLLFLLALILPAVLSRKGGRWEPVADFRTALINIVTIVTFFTIAHSVTLTLAALDVVRLSSRLVETIIAGSIAVAAWANLVPKLNVKEWSIAFVFGLFHGFGFASVLGDIGLAREHLVLSLLGFNVGVELGQVAVICAVFPFLFLLRKTGLYAWILRFGSWFLVSVALYWAFERAFDVDIPIVSILTTPFTWLFGS